MKKKKWIYIIGIIVIIVPVLYLYVSFNSTFVSKWKAKQIALDYLNEVYDENQFWYTKTNYTFIDNSYYVRYMANGPTGEYSATVEVGNGLWPTKVLYTNLHDNPKNAVLDDQIMEQARTQLLTLLKDYPILNADYFISSPSTLGYTLETFSLNEKTPFMPSISIYLTKEDRSLKEAEAIVKGIQKTLNENGVYYVDFYVQQDQTGSNERQYAFDVTKTTITSIK